MQKISSFFPEFVVFAAGFCLMVIAIVAVRIMAPHFGVSLYSWTGVIAAVLAGIALGNFYGGKLADRYTPRPLLGVLLIASGLVTAAAGFLSGPVGSWLEEAPVVLAVILYAFLIFFPPAALMGAVSPLIIKMELKNLGETGKTAGRIYMWSTLGSILGILATEFFLISFVHTRTMVSLVALVLFLLGLVALGKKDLWKRVEFWAAALFIGVSFFAPSICTRESIYFCIRVRDLGTFPEGKGYVLVLDHLAHGFVFPDPKRGVSQFWYEGLRVVSRLIAMGKTTSDAFSVLSLGGGGYIVPRYLEANYPRSENTVVEIDPAVTAVAYEMLELKQDTEIKSVNEDARLYLKRLPPEARFDFILNDTFNYFSVPFHLTTKEFNDLVKRHLAEGGLYAIHLLDSYPRAGQFLASVIQTMGQTFPYTYLFAGPQWKDQKQGSFVVAGSERPIDREKWGKAELPVLIGAFTEKPGNNKANQRHTRRMDLVAEEELKELLRNRKPIILTDGFVPAEQMLAALWH